MMEASNFKKEANSSPSHCTQAYFDDNPHTFLSPRFLKEQPSELNLRSLHNKGTKLLASFIISHDMNLNIKQGIIVYAE